MDMTVANLFKHNIFFRLVAHDPDRYEPLFFSKGYHYVSNEIENGKSIGFESVHDVYGPKMIPLFRYIFSNMLFDMENPVRITIRVHLISGTDYKKHIIYSEYFENEDNFSMEESESVFYTHPRNLLDQKFSIYVEGYCYFVKQSTTPIAPKVEAFKEDCCVICLEAKPNILYLDCMHIAICDSCDRMKSKTSSQSTCDVCRAKISKRVKI